MEGNESAFGLKLVFLLAVFLLLVFLFNMIMRRWLKVEKKKIFSYNHVNEKHKNIDWTIRITFIGILITGFFININRDFTDQIRFLETWFLLLVFIVASELARAFMEWKYAVNPKSYILTLSQLVFILALVFTLIGTDFFGML